MTSWELGISSLQECFRIEFIIPIFSSNSDWSMGLGTDFRSKDMSISCFDNQSLSLYFCWSMTNLKSWKAKKKKTNLVRIRISSNRRFSHRNTRGWVHPPKSSRSRSQRAWDRYKTALHSDNLCHSPPSKDSYAISTNDRSCLKNKEILFFWGKKCLCISK